ncbi:uncharacterized protein Dere_GG26817 [Drosophila erecta]|uniref:Uncharacterized protein n=1 Tax=Drosophila erecta TaxID=7220 RepID=A0A0Q5VM89_DROER|nr:uncharacterized protein Dere_GG26817 [Drosophila erecta]
MARNNTAPTHNGLLASPGTSGMDGPTPGSSWCCLLDPPV